jgi:hypothetical protein
MATTPNYGWVFPDPTDLVKDLPADFEIFADAVDADLADLLGGADKQILQKASAADHDFQWVQPGGMTQLATGNFSGSATNITSIPSGYKDLYVVIRDFNPNTDGASLSMRMNNDSGTNYFGTTSNTSSNQIFSTTQFNSIMPQQDNGATISSFGIIRVFDYTNTATWKTIEFFGVTNNQTTPANINSGSGHGIFNSTSAITELNFFCSSGNFGTLNEYFVYGVN